MSEEAPVSVVLYASDLMFRSKIGAEARAAGRKLAAAGTPEALAEKTAANDVTLVLIDMDMDRATDAIRAVRADREDAEIVAYFSHVRDDLRQAAEAAGATHVLPRSQFVVRLPHMLQPNG